MLDLLYFDEANGFSPDLDSLLRQLFASQFMDHQKDWPHAPVHRLDSVGVYMFTGATLHKAHLFSADEQLSLLETRLLKLAKQFYWQLEAWAVFVNHYHFIARAMLTQTHSTSFSINYTPIPRAN